MDVEFVVISRCGCFEGEDFRIIVFDCNLYVVVCVFLGLEVFKGGIYLN